MLERDGHLSDGFPPHALFRRRVHSHTVSGDELPASIPMRIRIVFLPVRPVSTNDVRVRGGGRCKPLATFLSLLHVKVHESPLVFVTFHFGPWTFNFVFGPDFCYRSFDLVRLGPSIEINSMLMFHFSPSSFNFRIGFRNINLFSTTV